MTSFAQENSHVRGGIFNTRRTRGGLLEGVPTTINEQRQVYTRFLDFDQNEDTTVGWVATTITGGTLALNTAGTGSLRLSHGTANQGFGSVQFADDTLLLAPTAGKVITFGALVDISDVSDADWYIGLAETDTTFLEAAGTLATNGSDNMAGFYHLVADANTVDMIQNGTAGTAQETNATALPVDNTFIEYGVRITGTQNVEFYMDGIKQGSTVITTAAMDTALVPTFAIVDNGNTVTMDIDYTWWSITR